MDLNYSTDRKIFLTGITGFIGKAIARALTEVGYEVTALVRPQSLEKINELPLVKYKSADLAKPETLTGVIDPCAVVIHAASIRNRWGTSSETYRAINVEATRSLIEDSLGKTKRFIYISSVGVFGFPGISDIDENSAVINPGSKLDYHSSKVLAEKTVRQFASQLETVIIRPTITYGIGDTNGMITRLIKLISDQKYIQIGNGLNHLHLTYIDDLVNGILLATTHPKAAGQTFILSGPESITMHKLVEIIKQLRGIPQQSISIPVSFARLSGWIFENLYHLQNRLDRAPIKKEPFITQDKVKIMSAHRSFSFSKAAYLLGYTPKINYLEGLSQTITWMMRTGQFQ